MNDSEDFNNTKMYLMEYQEISNNMRSLWKVRLTILGFVITLLGILIKQFDSDHWIKTIILQTTLLLIICGTTFILINLTKHLIIYGLRLAEIEERFFRDGFWKRWGNFMKNYWSYSNTRAIAITMQMLNAVIVAYILWKNFEFLNGQHPGGLTCTVLLFLFGVGNAFFIQTRLNPQKHWDFVKQNWEKPLESI